MPAPSAGSSSGSRGSAVIVGRAACQGMIHGNIQAMVPGQTGQDFFCLRHDLRAYSVSGKYQHVMTHFACRCCSKFTNCIIMLSY